MKKPYTRSPIKVGDTFNTNQSGKVTVVSYESVKAVEVLFHNSGKTRWVRGDHLKTGNIKDFHQPTVFGVGIVGDNPVRVDGKISEVYNYWSGILERCYSDKLHEKYPSYLNCTVSEEWKSLGNFRVWFEDNYREGWEIDKDLLVEGNKHYSKETCRFIPKSLNNLFKENWKLNTKNLPLGVTENVNGGYLKYNASCCIDDNVRVSLGNYSTPEEAFSAYKVAKEAYVKVTALRLYSERCIDKALLKSLLRKEVKPYE